MSRVADIEIFVSVVEAGQFSAAARALELSKSYVSKRVAALEEHLGVRLLHRTTRSLTLTPQGTAYYERCADALGQLDEAEQILAEDRTALAGKLRISAPLTFGLQYVAPAIAEFAATHRELDVRIDYTDRMVDLGAEGFDMGIRVGGTDDERLQVRPLAAVRLYIVASPGYLERRGIPERPEDLVEHDCLLYTRARDPHRWVLGERDDAVVVRVDGRMASDTGDALMVAAAHGLGLVIAPDFMAGPYLRSGALHAVLQPWTRPMRSDVRGVCPHERFVPTRVTAFLDTLQERFAHAPWAITDVG